MLAALQLAGRKAMSFGGSGHRGMRGFRLPMAAMAALVLATAALASREAPAQPSAPSQYDVEAVYLFDFAKFVRWPASGGREDLTICIAGQKTYNDTLAKVVAGERIDNRALDVRSVDRPEDEQGCSVLFLDASARERLDRLLAAAAGRPMLTVSDIPGFLDHGGMIQFVITGNRVRFAVDLRPVARSGISLSSELLKVAASVQGVPAGEGKP
jgi:hypothetical protein